MERVDSWQHGGNTLLGTAPLLVPIAVAVGKTLKENNEMFDLGKLRTNTKSVITSATPEDAVAVYEALDIAKPGGLNKAPKFDATEPSSKQKILETARRFLRCSRSLQIMILFPANGPIIIL